MAYGTPSRPEEVESYYTHIRRGRAPTPEQLEELVGRYDAIGGVSPLAQRTEAQRAAIQRALDEGAGAGTFRVVLGNKHAQPFIEDAADMLVDAGITRVIGLVLAPHYSETSVGAYQQRLARRVTDRAADRFQPATVVGVEQWHDEDAFRSFLATAIRDVLASLPERTLVLFTAHSLPERVLADDPYPAQLAESASAIAQGAGLKPGDWSLAWQSAGRTPEPWRGPDVLDVIREVGAQGHYAGVLVCPQGFTADHLEILYDLDVQACAVAASAGLVFGRTRSINDDPSVMTALAERVAAVARATADA